MPPLCWATPAAAGELPLQRCSVCVARVHSLLKRSLCCAMANAAALLSQGQGFELHDARLLLPIAHCAVVYIAIGHFTALSSCRHCPAASLP